MPHREELELTALKFPDKKTFYEATDVAAEKDLQINPIGDFTIVIRKSDRLWFKSLEPQEQEILDPDTLNPQTLARLHP